MMSDETTRGSFFPSSHAIITGGSFTIHNGNTYVQGGVKSGYERLLDLVAPNALHDSGHIVDPPKCHPGTRVAIIQMIIDWVAGSNEHNRDKLITWLTGAAGAGKSAIGRSVCERCKKEGTLLASFFFGSNDPSRNHSKCLVSTIAYQISLISPGVKKAITEFIDYDPLIFTRSLRAQLSSLVIGPLLANYSNTPEVVPPLIVLDGLDECLDQASQRDVLETFLFVVTSSSFPIRVLVCSRPESNITSSFCAGSMSPMVFKIFLGDEYSPDDDIRLYLCDNFREIRDGHIFKTSIPLTWPGEEIISLLLYKASGQFIYASTVIRYLKSPRHRPHQRLDAILGLRPPFKDLPFAELDALYIHFLENTDDPALVVDLLAFIVMYPGILLTEMEEFFQLEDGEIEVVLSDLASIVQIEISFGELVAQVLHKSFGDFIFDAHRSKDFSRNYWETSCRHIHHLIEMFSVFPSPEFSASQLILGVMESPSVVWTESSHLALLKSSVVEFPMELFCKWFLLDNARNINGTRFISSFLSFVAQLENQKIVEGARHQHVGTICDYVLSELKTGHFDDWETNFIFAYTFLESYEPRFSWNIRRHPLQRLPSDKNIGIHQIFKERLEEKENIIIISKAAAYCLEYVCDISHGKYYKKHLQLGGINRKMVKTCPWKWSARNRCLKEASRQVLLSTMNYWPTGLLILIADDSQHFTQVTKRRAVSSFHPFNWIRCSTEIAPIPDIYYEYMAYLNFFIDILPCAAPFRPLTELCKTRCFAPMSMMLPNLTRRARRAIAVYLARVQSDIDL